MTVNANYSYILAISILSLTTRHTTSGKRPALHSQPQTPFPDTIPQSLASNTPRHAVGPPPLNLPSCLPSIVIIVVTVVVGIIRPPRRLLSDSLVSPVLQQHAQRQHGFLSLDLSSHPVAVGLAVGEVELVVQLGEHGEGGALDGGG